jgi:hypothetical protein
MAAEGARMIDEQANPPRVAQMLLHIALRPHDAESIAGDLLEEYRAVRRPSLGWLRADAWYVLHVLSVVGRPVWPFALALVAIKSVLTAFMLFPLVGRWNPSLVPAPNVSLLDAMFFLSAGYYGARRTGRVVTGVVNSGALGLLDFAMFAAYATLTVPTLFASIAEKPFILVIGCIFLAMGATFALTLGAVGAVVAAWSREKSPGADSL